MKFPKNALRYWDEGNWKLYPWYKKGFWKRFFRKCIDRRNKKEALSEKN